MTNQNPVEAISLIKEMESSEAACWLMEKYSVASVDYEQAFILLTKRSWKKSDQTKLANYYLKRMPFASVIPYEIFLRFMAFDAFLNVIKENIPKKEQDRSLVLYHLVPALRKAAKTEKEKNLTNDFLKEFGS
jgi:hypothetical protein